MPLAIAWHLLSPPQVPAEMPLVELHTEYVIFSFLINLQSRAECTWNLQAGTNSHQTTELGLWKGVVALDSISTGLDSINRKPSQPHPHALPHIHTGRKKAGRREDKWNSSEHLRPAPPGLAGSVWRLLFKPTSCKSRSMETPRLSQWLPFAASNVRKLLR